MKIYQFDPVIYPALIWIVKGRNLGDEILDTFRAPDGEEIKLDGHEKARAGTWLVARKEDLRIGVLIWEITSVDVEVCAHEAVHAVNLIFDRCDVGYDTVNDEHFAFFVGKVAQWIYNVSLDNEVATI